MICTCSLNLTHDGEVGGEVAGVKPTKGEFAESTAENDFLPDAMEHPLENDEPQNQRVEHRNPRQIH